MSVKISDLTAGSVLDSVDLFAFVDISDTTMAATGTTKKITYNDLLTAISGSISSNTIYSADDTISGNRNVGLSTNSLAFGTSVFSMQGANGRVGVGTANAFTDQVAYASESTYASYLVTRTASNRYGINHNDGTIELASYISNTEAYFGTITNHPYLFMVNDGGVGAINTNGNFSFGSTSDLSARVGIRGSGSTNGTNSLIIQNSVSSQYALFRNDKYIALGGNDTGNNLFVVDGANSALGFNLTNPVSFDNCDITFLGTGLRTKIFEVFNGFENILTCQSSGASVFGDTWDSFTGMGEIRCYLNWNTGTYGSGYDVLKIGTGVGEGIITIGSSTNVWGVSTPKWMDFVEFTNFHTNYFTVDSLKGFTTPNDSAPYAIPYLEVFSSNADTGGETQRGESRISSIGDSWMAVNAVGTAYNVGIGTKTPAKKLHVVGDIRVDGTTSGASSGSSGTFLTINVGGTDYKIDLHTV